MNERQRMVTEAVWKTIVLAYGEPRQSEDQVQIPAREAVSALLTCAANVIAAVPDRNERRQLIAHASPAVGKAVSDKNAGRNLLMPQSGIVLPS